MRKIKFRAWDKKTSNIFYHDEIYWFNRVSIKGYEHYQDVVLSTLLSDSDFILMQYTGLKDKNGKEIYEGDILKHPNNNTLFEIKYIKEYCGFRAVYDRNIYNHSAIILQIGDKGQAEIIGNIYENPELLEG